MTDVLLKQLTQADVLLFNCFINICHKEHNLNFLYYYNLKTLVLSYLPAIFTGCVQ